jgi:hypothetical protein
MTKIINKKLTEQEIAERELDATKELARNKELVQQNRRYEYSTTSDPIFFGYQRGENTKEEWLAAIKSVKEANPYPEEQ